MMRQYGFYFDMNGCTGCKACVLACKDKNDLPRGLLWRKVREKEGGCFEKQGQGLVAKVFAFWLSLSCHHCQQPPCIDTCPVGALEKRNGDGLVLLDDELCIGCGMCLSACPYGALQMNEETGKMSKCNACLDLLGQGESPACVGACPLRVLDFGPLEQLQGKYPAAIPYDALMDEDVIAAGGKHDTGKNAGGQTPLPSLLVKPHRHFTLHRASHR